MRQRETTTSRLAWSNLAFIDFRWKFYVSAEFTDKNWGPLREGVNN